MAFYEDRMGNRSGRKGDSVKKKERFPRRVHFVLLPQALKVGQNCNYSCAILGISLVQSFEYRQRASTPQ